MLTQISVKNLGVIEHVELELDAGLTIITGETGAGKSMIIRALGLALGDRADGSVVRTGAARAEISLSFEVTDRPAAKQWLEDQDLLLDGECVLRRSVAAEGRSRAYINGSAVPLSSLKALAEHLMDIHGQNEHYSLMKTEVQRDLLDAYGGLQKPLGVVAKAFTKWRESMRQLNELQAAAGGDDQLLSYQVEELDALSPELGEAEQLHQEHKRLANAGSTQADVALALQHLSDGDGGEADDSAALIQLGLATRKVSELANHDESFAPIAELLSAAHIQLDEAVAELRHQLDHVELDPERLYHVEQRLQALHDISRKHHVEPEQLPEHHAQLAEKLTQMRNAESLLQELETAVDEALGRYHAAAEKLSNARGKVAKKLAAQVTVEMRELGMPDGEFSIALTRADEPKPTAKGIDQVEMLVTTNPGSPAGPLRKTASGGELARISLAIQVVSAQAVSTPCLVFDEVDTGIGGGVAEIVGAKLRALGHKHQVLCVTHLAQVAAHGHQHLMVRKKAGADATYSGIEPLSAAERGEELARMLGGVEITSNTKAHADEMLARAQVD